MMRETNGHRDNWTDGHMIRQTDKEKGSGLKDGQTKE